MRLSGTLARRSALLGAASALLAASIGLVGQTSSAAGVDLPEATAVAFQGNALHDGDQPNEVLPATPTLEWDDTFDGQMSYAVIVGGRVFAVVGTNGGDPLSQVVAIDAATGHVDWTSPLTPVVGGGGYTDNSGLAYDEGRVFAVDDDGDVTALDAATGHVDWFDQGGDQSQSSPTAANGILYFSTADVNSTLVAVSEATGQTLWTRSFMSGFLEAPTVTSTGVYVTSDCDRGYDFDPTSGKPLWDLGDTCQGGGSDTAVFHAGSLYATSYSPDVPGLMLNAATGATVRSLPFSLNPPAFDGSMQVSAYGRVIQATDATTGAVLWSQTIASTFVTSPLLVGGTIYVGEASGTVEAFDPRNGAPTWTATAPAPMDFRLGKSGLAAGDGLLVVPAGGHLLAYGAATTTSPAPSSSAPPSSATASSATSSTAPVTSSAPSPLPTSTTIAPVVTDDSTATVGVFAPPAPRCDVPKVAAGETLTKARAGLEADRCRAGHDIEAPAGYPRARRGMHYAVVGFAIERVTHVRRKGRLTTVRAYTRIHAGTRFPTQTAVSLVVGLVKKS